jgi:hypothetical protein
MKTKKKFYKRPSFSEVLKAKKEYEENPFVELNNPQRVFIDPEFSEELKLINTEFISVVGNFEITTEIENEKPVLIIKDADSYDKKIRIGFPSFDEFKQAVNLLYMHNEVPQVDSHFTINPLPNQILYKRPINKKKMPIWVKVVSVLALFGGTVGYLKLKKS